VIALFVIKNKFRLPVHFDEKSGILFIFISGLLLRIIWVTISDNIQTSDFSGYFNMAGNIVNGDYKDLFARHPGPQLFLAAHRYLFGLNTIYPLLTIVVFSSIEIIILYKIVSLFFIDNGNNNISIIPLKLLPSFIYAFWPESIIYTNLTGTDRLFSFFLLLTFYFIIKTTKDNQYRYAILSGITLGIAHWFRPIGLIFLLTFIFFIILSKNKFPEKESIKTLFMVVITYFTFLSPLAIYSYNNNGTLNPFYSSLTGWYLMVGTNIEHDGRINKDDENLLDSLRGNESRDYKRDRIAKNIGIKRILNNPIAIIIKGLTTKQKILWSSSASINWSMQGYLKNKPKDFIYKTLNYYCLVYHRIIMILAIYFMFYSFINRNLITHDLLNLLTTIILSLFLISSLHVLIEVQPRYHHILLTYFSLLIGIGFFITYKSKSPNI